MVITLIERVEKARKAQSLIPADMARYFGVNPQNYNNWIYRNSLPKKYYDTAYKFIFSDEDDRMFNYIPEKLELKLKQDSTTIPVSNIHTFSVPILQAEASMGSGFSVEHIDPDQQIGEVSMPLQEFLSLYRPKSSADKCLIVRGTGDSMKGMYEDGEQIVIDTGVQSFIGNGCYAFHLTGDSGIELYIKNIEKTPDGYNYSSHNKDSFPTVFKIKPEHNFKILGAVLGVYKRFWKC